MLLLLMIGLVPLFVPLSLAFAQPKQADIEAYRALVVLDERLATTGYRLAKANASFCKIRTRNPGWVLHSYRQYPDRDTARAAFRFHTPVAIAATAAGGPADMAGLKAGDSLVDMPGGAAWGEDADPHRSSYALIVKTSNRLAQLFAGGGAVPLTFHTGQGEQKLLLDPPPVCASQFRISTGGSADAGADGTTVRISAKLANFTAIEDEFAFLVAHELAHNVLQHRALLDSADVKRGIGRMFGESKQLIRASEVEADRLALWLINNAGYDPAAGLTFMERFGRKYGPGFFADGTHYQWRQRQEIMREELALLSQTKRGKNGRAPPLLITGSQILR